MTEIWVQVHNLPLAYLTRKNVEKIAEVFPMLVEMDFDNDDEYERLLDFCYHCGRLSLTVRECCDKHDGIKKAIFGHWLKAMQSNKKKQNHTSNKGNHSGVKGKEDDEENERGEHNIEGEWL
ncbi:hypothetical protein REPUB_Repub08aG0129400 [Reevesia pubescens]